MSESKPIMLLLDRTQPTEAQMRSGRYPKRKLPWKGLEIRIENEAGTFRRGLKPDGATWETLMHFAYGEVARSEGADGDPVDVYLGPDIEGAPYVYVVHQRKVGAWDEYDEDKCMLGFASEQDAIDAFLTCYDDPRFLGPITVMTADEFVAKVKATRKEPGMIKSFVYVLKAHVGPYVRHGSTVRGYDRKDQLDLFAHQPSEPVKVQKFYATMIRSGQQAGKLADPTKKGNLALLAGPFDDHDTAKRYVEPAREKAIALDGYNHFHAFGTTGVEMEDGKHPPGKLNDHFHLGDNGQSKPWQSAEPATIKRVDRARLAAVDIPETKLKAPERKRLAKEVLGAMGYGSLDELQEKGSYHQPTGTSGWRDGFHNYASGLVTSLLSGDTTGGPNRPSARKIHESLLSLLPREEPSEESTEAPEPKAGGAREMHGYKLGQKVRYYANGKAREGTVRGFRSHSDMPIEIDERGRGAGVGHAVAPGDINGRGWA